MATKATGRHSVRTPKAYPLGTTAVGVHLDPICGHGQPASSITRRAAEFEGDTCSKLRVEKRSILSTLVVIGKSA
jgi:hypothetical protein